MADTSSPTAVRVSEASGLASQETHDKWDFSWLLFSFHGRIGRIQWLVVSLVAAALCGVAVFILAIVIYWIMGVALAIPMSDIDEAFDIFAIYALVPVIPFAWIMLALTINRLHDMNMTGTRIFFVFIPLIGWLFLIAMLISLVLRAGTPGPTNMVNRCSKEYAS